MKTLLKSNATFGVLLVSAAVSMSVQGSEPGHHSKRQGASPLVDHVLIGSDRNSSENPFVQPQDPALAGGGRDQSLQFGDVLLGRGIDLINGRLGSDVIIAGAQNDVMIGGLEHFNPSNRDRVFGGRGADVFIWKPGDGSDLFQGGPGQDAIVFGLTGENVDGHPVFEVVADQQAGELFIDEGTGLPKVDVTNSPGFCEVIDRNTSVEAAEQLAALELDHLVQFSIRGVRNAFEAGEQAEDNGLRVTLHLQDVEVLVCTNRDGGLIEVIDLRSSPARSIQLRDLKRALRERLENMLI